MPGDWRKAMAVLAMLFRWPLSDLNELTLAECRRWLKVAEEIHGEIAPP